MKKDIKTLTCALLLLLLWNCEANFAQAQPAEDSKDFRVKGFHLDLRIQVMKMPALKAFALNLSKNGINTLVMEWEGSYPFEKHAVISNKYAYSRAEVKSFIAYCDSLKIDVIPLQQSFGHVEYILKNYRYRELREDEKDYSQVNPIKEELCKSLFSDLFKDLISTHRSKYIHIGGDETYLLGKSKESKRKADSLGMGRLYGDYIKMLCETVVGMGKIPLVWADIALKYPDALKSLPKETIFIDWNYGWEMDRFGDHEKLMKSGFEIWGSPALRSGPDSYFSTDWNKHLDNIRVFIPQARALGYKGMIMTSWSTSGIYSQIFETHSDIMDLHAIRRVYPISGFNLLIDAFFKGLAAKQPLVPAEFVNSYAKRTYGLSDSDAGLFWNALKLAPYEVKQGKVSKAEFSISQLCDSAMYALKTLKAIKVTKTQNEYAHYLLMANIRYNYLIGILVEHELNKPDFNRSQAAPLLKKLSALNIQEVDAEFVKLNSGLLQEMEIAEEVRLRNFRYVDLSLRLKKMTNQP